MDTFNILDFLLKARAHTYASGAGKVKPVFPDLFQLEYQENNLLYRDIYNLGNGLFMGLETVYMQNKPLFSMSYFGNFGKITEKEADTILRKALIENWHTTRLWHNVTWKSKNYEYSCKPNSNGSLTEFSGKEKILKDGIEVYYFSYAGGYIA